MSAAAWMRTPLAAMGRWVAQPPVWRVGVLALLVLASALAVVDAAHRVRTQFGALERLRLEHDALLERRGRLLLERSAFSAYSRIETIAHGDLDMKLPKPGDTELVEP